MKRTTTWQSCGLVIKASIALLILGLVLSFLLYAKKAAEQDWTPPGITDVDFNFNK